MILCLKWTLDRDWDCGAESVWYFKYVWRPDQWSHTYRPPPSQKSESQVKTEKLWMKWERLMFVEMDPTWEITLQNPLCPLVINDHLIICDFDFLMEKKKRPHHTDDGRT